MICSKCSINIGSDDKYCPECGQKQSILTKKWKFIGRTLTIFTILVFTIVTYLIWSDYQENLLPQSEILVVDNKQEVQDFRRSFDKNHLAGDGDAPIFMVLYLDFQTTESKQLSDNLLSNEKIGEYADSGKLDLVIKPFLLSDNPNAYRVAEAAECAAQQNQYFYYLIRLLEGYPNFSLNDLKMYARNKKLGPNSEEISDINADVFDTCLINDNTAKIVEKNIDEGKQDGVTKAPTTIINGKRLEGLLPFEAYDKLFQEILAKEGNSFTINCQLFDALEIDYVNQVAGQSGGIEFGIYNNNNFKTLTQVIVSQDGIPKLVKKIFINEYTSTPFVGYAYEGNIVQDKPITITIRALDDNENVVCDPLVIPSSSISKVEEQTKPY